MPHDLPQLQHAILGALLGFGGPKRLGDGQDGLSSMVTGHVSFANTTSETLEFFILVGCF